MDMVNLFSEHAMRRKMDDMKMDAIIQQNAIGSIAAGFGGKDAAKQASKSFEEFISKLDYDKAAKEAKKPKQNAAQKFINTMRSLNGDS